MASGFNLSGLPSRQLRPAAETDKFSTTSTASARRLLVTSPSSSVGIYYGGRRKYVHVGLATYTETPLRLTRCPVCLKFGKSSEQSIQGINKLVHDQHQTNAFTRQLESALVSKLDASDGSHDIYHARRVRQNAIDIATIEGGADLTLLTAGAYLHDLINVPKNSPQRANASQLSAEAAVPILQQLGMSTDDIESVKHMIITHSFSANIQPETLEAKILQDSDRLEAIGAIGIARVFYIAGKLDSSLFDGNDPFALTRDLDDRRFALDHFKVKLLGLADTMQTGAGRQIALERTQTMRDFLDIMGKELAHDNPW